MKRANLIHQRVSSIPFLTRTSRTETKSWPIKARVASKQWKTERRPCRKIQRRLGTILLKDSGTMTPDEEEAEGAVVAEAAVVVATITIKEGAATITADEVATKTIGVGAMMAFTTAKAAASTTATVSRVDGATLGPVGVATVAGRSRDRVERHSLRKILEVAKISEVDA